MKDISHIISGGSACFFIAGGLMLGLAGMLYQIRVGSLWANPTHYNKIETRLASAGILLLIVSATIFVIQDIFYSEQNGVIYKPIRDRTD